MRAVLVVSLCALLGPAAALAQTAPAPPTEAATPTPPPTAPASPSRTSTRGGDITRDEYIAAAVERAKRAAAARFDRMDTNHDGILTADERHAARATRRAQSQQ